MMSELINKFQTEIDKKFEVLLGSTDKVVLLDQPTHRNLGDTFIWRGEIDLLKRINKKIIYKANNIRINWGYLDSLDESIPLLLHGGGNMGDTWIHYEEFRRKIVERYPNRPIIILPQTIYYSNEYVLEETKKVFEKASNLVICSRTKDGYEFCKKEFTSNQIEFCYDMALSINKINNKSIKGRGKFLIVARDDKESKDIYPLDSYGYDVDDWKFTERNKKCWDWIQKINRIIVSKKVPTLINVKVQNLQSDLMTYCNMQAAFNMFNGCSKVATNRLHAHIFASLLGIENYVADNNYGKIGDIYTDYTHKFPNALFCGSLQEAIDLMQGK